MFMRKPEQSRPFVHPRSREALHAKIEPHKTKKRLRKTYFEKRGGKPTEKYEKDLQEKTPLGRIFSSVQRHSRAGVIDGYFPPGKAGGKRK